MALMEGDPEIGAYPYTEPLRTKFGWVAEGHGAEGPVAVDDAVRAMDALGAAYADSQQFTSSVLGEMDGGWQGLAAGRAGEALQAMAGTGADAGTAGSGGGISLGQYATSFQDLRAAVRRNYDEEFYDRLTVIAPTVLIASGQNGDGRTPIACGRRCHRAHRAGRRGRGGLRAAAGRAPGRRS